MIENNQSYYPDDQDDGLRTLMLDDMKGRKLFIGSSSVIGRRKYQQDSILTDTNENYDERSKAIAILCDGMGGLVGGEKASSLCASIVHSAYHAENRNPSVPDFFKSVIPRADDGVKYMKDENGTPITGAGTTFISVVVEDNNLYWASVGDSRIYVVRGDEILCVTQDHNYLMLLNEKVENGEMTQEEANSHPKREALVSYMGMGGVPYISMNSKPLPLINGDTIILCSDGLYRSVSEAEMKDTVLRNGADSQYAAEFLTGIALGKGKKNQDNTSVIVIRFSDSE